MTIFVFDIETIPDIERARLLHNFSGLADKDVAQALFSLQKAKTGHEFLPHYLQKVVAISLVLASTSQLKVWTLGDEATSESEMVQRFFMGIEKYTPTLISWNGSGFDLPVLHYRALLHGVNASAYWEIGDNHTNFRWNNYLNRFHYRHLDLMDVLASYQNKAFAPLDDIATMLGFPGKMGMNGSQVWDEYLNGNLQGIRNYCETDVLNTYCVYLKFERMRGLLNKTQYDHSIKTLQNYLAKEQNKPHFQEFLQKMSSV